jgi:hypothetical protein
MLHSETKADNIPAKNILLSFSENVSEASIVTPLPNGLRFEHDDQLAAVL